MPDAIGPPRVDARPDPRPHAAPLMTAKDFVRWAVLIVGCLLLYVWGMSWRGLVGPDEPRYASIARQMSESGDWVTPQLDGRPWFEKPVLLYWLGAAADRAGLDDDRATRLPVAALSIVFLLYYNRRLRRQFGDQAGDGATAVLATAAGWAAYSQAGVFDLPLAVATGAALLELLDWVRDPEAKRRLPYFGALLGMAVLAKGLAGPAIAAFAVFSVYLDRGLVRVARDLFAPRVLLPFAAVAGPWYVLCWLRNGSVFVEEFFWKHHVLRLVSSELEHVMPWWYYIPVLLVALAPWTPLAFALSLAEIRRDPRLRFLAFWAVGTVVFFSLATNKLPGYLLPALPAFAALIGLGLRAARSSAWFASGATLALFPLAAALLPIALADGIRKAWPPSSLSMAPMCFFVLFGAAISITALRRRPDWAAGLLTGGAFCGLLWLKISAFPALDQAAGARPVWSQAAPGVDSTCVGEVRRHIAYGLAYYGRGALPPCDLVPRSLSIAGDPPRLQSRIDDK